MNIKAITRAMELSDDDWELATKLRALSEPERELLMTALGPQKPAAKKSSKKAVGESRHCGYRFESSNTLCNCLFKNRVHHDQGQLDYHQFQSTKTSEYISCLRCGAPRNDSSHGVGASNYHLFEPSTGKKSARQQSISEQIQQRRPRGVVTSDDDDHHGYGMCAHCPNPSDHNIHHLTSFKDYHPFVLAAQSVELPSSLNSESESSTASTEGEGVSAGVVAQGAGGGD